MATQIIRPAGAGHETVWVLMAGVLIVALAAAVVGVRTTHAPVEPVAEHQIDARRDLTPAEQGLYADLRIAVDEIRYDSSLSVQGLADLGIAPFVMDASGARRGGHAWQRLTRGSQVGYLGVSAEPTVAGALLLLVRSDEAGVQAPTHIPHEHTEPNIWLHRGESVTLADQLNAASLARTGWRQIVAQFDAGVTRERRTSPTP